MAAVSRTSSERKKMDIQCPACLNAIYFIQQTNLLFIYLLVFNIQAGVLYQI